MEVEKFIRSTYTSSSSISNNITMNNIHNNNNNINNNNHNKKNNKQGRSSRRYSNIQESSYYKMCLVICFLFVLFEIFDIVEARKKGTARKNKGVKKRDFAGFMKTFCYIVGMVFIPVFGIFFYAIAKDPLTPKIIQLAYARAKDKWFSYLGKEKVDYADNNDEEGDEGQTFLPGEREIYEYQKELLTQRNVGNL